MNYCLGHEGFIQVVKDQGKVYSEESEKFVKIKTFNLVASSRMCLGLPTGVLLAQSSWGNRAWGYRGYLLSILSKFYFTGGHAS